MLQASTFMFSVVMILSRVFGVQRACPDFSDPIVHQIVVNVSSSGFLSDPRISFWISEITRDVPSPSHAGTKT
jgi:hypothetical protein